MESVWSQLSGVYSLWDHWSQDEKTHRVGEVLMVRDTLLHCVRPEGRGYSGEYLHILRVRDTLRSSYMS